MAGVPGKDNASKATVRVSKDAEAVGGSVPERSGLALPCRLLRNQAQGTEGPRRLLRAGRGMEPGPGTSEISLPFDFCRNKSGDP